MSNRLLVLGWHNIDPTPGFPDPPGAGRRGFARQLRLLDRVATVLPLSDALDRIERGEPLPPRAVALTFDDGYRDNLDLGVPMLARHGFPATFFLVPGFLSGRVGAWWEDLSGAFERATAASLTWEGSSYDLTAVPSRQAAHDAVRASVKQLDHAARVEVVADVGARIAPTPPPDAPLFMGWDGARALMAAGHDIGSHTITHAILQRETAAGQASELVDSRAELEKELGITVDTLAYPNGAAGDYSDVTVAAASEAGYRAAVTTRAGLASRDGAPYEMRRVVLTPTDDLGSMVGKVWRKARGRLPF